jgi:hypothetical protein
MISKSSWMDTQEALILQELMRQQEIKILRHNGLSWLVDFCSAVNPSNSTTSNSNINTNLAL